MSSAMGVAIRTAEGHSVRCIRDPPTVRGRIVGIARPPTIHSPPLFATMVRSDVPTSTVIVGQTPGEPAKTLFAASSGMARGVQIRLVGPPTRVLSRTNVTIGAASPRGVISKVATGPVKLRKTVGLHSHVHEARSKEGPVHPRTPIRAPVAGPLWPRFS